MIMDRLERFRCYQRSVPELWDAVRFAERVQKEQLPPGKYIVITWMYRSFWTDLKCGNMQTGQIWR